MSFWKKSVVLICIILFCGLPILAQKVRCGTVEYEQMRRDRNPALENTDQFEKWMSTKLVQWKQKLQRGERIESTYIIPVVVHIIHNGEPIGTGTNIDSAQVASQIAAINRDYPRMNADTANTPAEFKSVAGSIDIQFVLAKQDPEGLATNGITRTRGTQASWAESDDAAFKSLIYWPAENYLNIWVVNLVDPNFIIGYSQLPVSTLPGLESASSDRLTDGTVINYTDFGQGAGFTLDAQFNEGRTTTHEIGHILGLRHVWGDVTVCGGTDYCDDTPTQDAPTFGCPSTTAEKQACGHDKMYQNYMDYTDDPCYNLFTKDQIARMIIVLGNSPRRTSLLTSPGATDPVFVANDLGARNVITPDVTSCPVSLTPSLQIRNYGTNTVSSAQIQLTVNGVITETKTFSSLNLAQFDTTNVEFTPLTLSAASTNSISFSILQTNGGTDGKLSNNTISETVVIPAKVPVPLFEPFDSTPASWAIVNPDGLITWHFVNAPNSDPNNTAMYLDFYDYENDLGDKNQQDQLVTPIFDLSTDTLAILKFDRAYATTSNQVNDQLRVLVSTGCDFSHAVEIFNKSGSALATASNTSDPFTPKSGADWKTETISLAPFLGQPNVQIAFVTTNDWGNNLYLDNVSVITGSYTDLSLVGVKTPSLVTCVDNPAPVITIANNGSTTVQDITVSTTVNGNLSTQAFSGVQLGSGVVKDFTLHSLSLNSGTNTVTIGVVNTNGLLEVSPGDNALNLNEVLNTSQEVVPIRQNFDSGYPDWTIVSLPQQVKWLSTATGTVDKDLSLEYKAFANLSIGSQAWLVSPVLDFSQAQKSSLFFALSYAKSSAGNDRLQILASNDCGQTFKTIVFDQTSSQLAVRTTSSSWTPQNDVDWKRQYVNLDTLAGRSNVRLAFVATNDGGNNMFLDNVEIFVDDNPTPVAVNTLYSVYENYQPNFKIGFNLPEQQPVRMQIFSTMGKVVIDQVLPDVLNQTFDVDLTGNSSGIYIVRLQIGNQIGIAKVFVGN